MRDYKILLVDGDSQNLQELGRFLNERGCPVTKVFNTNADGEMLRQKALDSTSELQKFTPTDDILTMLKIMSLDIQGPLVSMLATLKLLNRGYYGKMDEEVANKIKKLLSNATLLIGITEEFLGRASAANEEFEIEAEPLHSIQEIINPVGALKQQSKLPRPQDGALKPKFSKPKTEIPKQVRDDKRRRPIPCCHAELVSASDQVFSAFSRHTFHPRPQDGVFRCDF